GRSVAAAVALPRAGDPGRAGSAEALALAAAPPGGTSHRSADDEDAERCEDDDDLPRPVEESTDKCHRLNPTRTEATRGSAAAWTARRRRVFGYQRQAR